MGARTHIEPVCTPQVAKAAMDKAWRVYSDKMKNVKVVQDQCTELKQDRKARWRKFQQIRSFIDNAVDSQFDEILQSKSQSGQLEMNHSDETLHISWQKDNMDEASQQENVMNLSGGERSFTTLALLLAIGEVIESPFRVMDEFDIFMDQASRKIALQTVCEMARKLNHRQFIFITPQDLSAITAAPDIKIVKLQPVNRITGQTTLD